MSVYRKYAPETLDETVLPRTIKDSLRRMQEGKRVENMLFYGEPGVGKTSVAGVLSKNLVKVSCAQAWNAKDLIKQFAVVKSASTCVALGEDDRTLILLDEVDTLTSAQQRDACRLIDESSDINSCFVATANDVGAVVKQLRSRLFPVCFDVDESNAEVRQGWKERLQHVFQMENGEAIRPEVLDGALRHFPDGRMMLAAIQAGFE